MALQISNFSQPDSSELLDVSESVFGQEYNETLVHQLIVKYQANARAGTKAQKTRSDVSGGGIKPWRQKGTGRARSGSSRSPIWRTGGVTFAARPRSYDQKLNKKMFKAGLRSILSELLRQERLLINDAILPTQPKTKELSAKLKAFNAKKLLIIVDKVDENLALSSRNIPNLKVVEAGNLNPVLLVGAEKIIMTSLALKIIEEHLS
ncbi:MAG: 50S ribosomal protein L4 [Methylobacter sp.]|nr:MAG: 50S ribosomal protein L4 [Methylobacter sp.]PPD23766.1 MAG: 50S ribosomal protein L4 [Methylobacter sp.]PPD34376.1 MAG: 50S ribosomal protein L4 [Methylomonas sp.]